MNRAMSKFRSVPVFILFVLIFSPGVTQAYYCNDTPSWIRFEEDITSQVPGAAKATLSFDLRNDPPPYDPGGYTCCTFYFFSGIDGYGATFHYADGTDTSHWRDVRLNIDGKEYRDQYGAYNDHLGDQFGTSRQGTWGSMTITGAPGTTYYFVRYEPKPDLLIKRSDEPDSAFALKGVYQMEPSEGQKRIAAVAGGGKIAFDVKIENAGQEKDPFVLKATGTAEAGWTIVYKAAGLDITPQILTAEGYTTSAIASGGSEMISIEISAGPEVQPGVAQSAAVKIYSSRASADVLDAVEVVVKQGILVTSTGDESDADPNDGICDVDTAGEGNQCTLRAALQQANRNSGKDAVLFDIPLSDPGFSTTTGTFVVSCKTALPDITEAVLIDATTQSGGRVEINGSNAGKLADGLHFLAGDSSVLGLTIREFHGNGVFFDIGAPSEMDFETNPHLYRINLSQIGIMENCGWGIKSGGEVRIGGNS